MMNSLRRFGFFIVLIQLMLLQNTPSFALAGMSLEGRLILTGSSTVAPLASELGRRFEQLHPNVRIDVQTGGSSRGIADLRRGLSQIGMISRPLKSQEKDLVAYRIASDGVTLIVHRSNTITELSDKEVTEIYRGRIKSWQTLGGSAHRITVVNKAEGHSTLELFTDYFGLINDEIYADVIVGDNAQGLKTVANDKNAIAYVSIGAAEYDAALGLPIKRLPIAGIDPSLDNLRQGRFPITRPLNFVFKEAPTGLAKAFLDFARSKEATPIIQEQFFVPFMD